MLASSNTIFTNLYFLFTPDSNGVVHTQIYNEAGNPEYKYFYHKIADVDKSMRKAISLLPNGHRLGGEGEELWIESSHEKFNSDAHTFNDVKRLMHEKAKLDVLQKN